MMKDQNFSSGFTLVELTVVLVIIALLIGGLLVPLSAQNDIRNRQEAEKALAEIKEALLGFAAVNGRLPCPADRAIPTGTVNAGIEQVAGTGCGCTGTNSGVAGLGGICSETTPEGVVGVLPWATLGLRETDSWGQRFTYQITTRFGRQVGIGHTDDFGASCPVPTTTTRSAFALCSQGDMSIQLSSGGITVANNIPAVIISHGRNGRGGYLSTGGQVLGATGDELENVGTGLDAAGNARNGFVSKTPIDDGANVYDDMTVWLPTNILMNRMIAVGRLP